MAFQAVFIFLGIFKLRKINDGRGNLFGLDWFFSWGIIRLYQGKGKGKNHQQH